MRTVKEYSVDFGSDVQLVTPLWPQILEVRIDEGMNGAPDKLVMVLLDDTVNTSTMTVRAYTAVSDEVVPNDVVNAAATLGRYTCRLGGESKFVFLSKVMTA